MVERFAAVNPAEHFYEHAIRFDEMFETLVLPLRNARSVRVDADDAEETAVTYRTRRYEFRDIDVILCFPAQVIHFARDDPRVSATATVYSDPRLAS